MIELVYEDYKLDMDDYIQDVVEIHAQATPFWTEYQENKKFDLINEIQGLEDLRKLPYFTDDDIRSRPPEDFVPTNLPKSQRVLSTSSGTTGEQKHVYWSRNIINHMVNYAEWVLRERDFPYNELWVCTGPGNDIFKIFLNDLAGRFDGDFKYLEVDAAAAKKAFLSKDPAAIKQFFDSVSGEVEKIAQEHDIGVYEDIAPLMSESADRLSEDKRNKIRGLLLGGVETTIEKIELFREKFPNAEIGGWYGDFMNGTGMIRAINPSGIIYQPFFPYVVWEVRDLDDIGKNMGYGERGEVITHRLGPDIFIPNRRIGDEAERMEPLSPLKWDGVKNVTRLPKHPDQ
ncbi:MAG: hypothetical protein ACE5J7_01505 [Candidatus Aenigmatarchaeota archaeon]